MKLLKVETKNKDDVPIIYKFLRDDKGKRIVSEDASLKPYFYVPDDSGKYIAFDGTKCEKLVFDTMEDFKYSRDTRDDTYEADIKIQNRYLIDCVDSLEYVRPRIMYLDIEVDNDGKMPKPEDANFIITNIGIYDDFTDNYTTFINHPKYEDHFETSFFDNRLHDIYYFNKEKDMLAVFMKFFKDSEPDIVLGWNLVSFDMVYLMNRITNLGMKHNQMSPIYSTYTRGLDVTIKGVALLDLMKIYKHLTENVEVSYRLDYIARKNCGEGKQYTDAPVRYLWNNEIENLISYNIQDVRLVKLIQEKNKFIDFIDEIRRTCFCNYEDTMTSTKTLDCYVLKMYHNKIVFNTKTMHESNEKYKGGFVETWAKGLYDNVAVFDLKSLYPSIIVSLNLSPENMDTDDSNFVEVNNHKVSMSKKGYLSGAIEQLAFERAKYKKLMKPPCVIDSDEYKLYDNRQKAVKVLMNAIYGQTAFPGSRFFDPRIADTTTFVGRKINEWSRNFLTNQGYKILYADTDSCFFSAGNELDIDKIKNLQKILNSSYDEFAAQYGVKNHKFEIEFQKIYRKAIFGTVKKRYAGWNTWKEGQDVDRMDIVGFEVRRSDSSQITRNMQSTIFDMILRKGNTRQEIIDFIISIINRIKTGDYKLTEIGIPKGISKDITEYKSPTINIRAADYAEKIMKIYLSSKPKMIYISKLPPGLPVTFNGKPVEALCFDEDSQIPAGTVVNIEVMLEKLIKNKVESIFDAMGWKLSDIHHDWRNEGDYGSQVVMGDFFNLADYGTKTKLV